MRIKIDNKIPFTDVLVVTKELCELIHEEECAIVRVPLELYNEENLLWDYISIMVCKEKEKKQVESEMLKQNHKPKSELEIPKGACHITTFKDNIVRNPNVTFDNNDQSCPVKAGFNEGYEYIDKFFRTFIAFRNKKLQNKEIVKEDDIYQYLYIVKQDVNKKRKQNRTRKK